LIGNAESQANQVDQENKMKKSAHEFTDILWDTQIVSYSAYAYDADFNKSPLE